MRILWFSNTAAGASDYLKLGSLSGGWLSSLANELKDKIELHVAFYHNDNMESFKYNGIFYHPIDMKLSKLRILINLFSSKNQDTEDLNEYLKIIKKVDPNIIHIHGTENAYGCIISHTTIPIVFSIQGIVSSIVEKYYSGISQNFGSKRSKNSLKDFFMKTTYNKNFENLKSQALIEQRNLKGAKYIIGRTKWDERITRLMAPQSRYFHCDEILREDFYFNRWTNNFKSNEIKIYTTSSSSIIKGFETICSCISILVESGKEVYWRVGGINENDMIVSVVKSKLKDRYPKMGLTLLGSLNSNQIIDELKNTNFYVMASHIENSPNSLCEAMIMGVPCIGSYSGGTSSLLSDSIEGYLFQDGDPWSLAGIISELHKNNDVALLLGENAHLRAKVRHDKERILNQYLEVYNQMA